MEMKGPAEAGPVCPDPTRNTDRIADRTADTLRFVKVGDELNRWTVSDGNGFQVLRFSRISKRVTRTLLTRRSITKRATR